MNRRGFLTSLAVALGTVAAAPGLALVPKPAPLGISIRLDLDRLLWVPGQKTIFLPPRCNEFYESDWIAREYLSLLENNLRVMHAVNREYDYQFKVGDRVTIQVPQPIQLPQWFSKVSTS